MKVYWKEILELKIYRSPPAEGNKIINVKCRGNNKYMMNVHHEY